MRGNASDDEHAGRPVSAWRRHRDVSPGDPRPDLLQRSTSHESVGGRDKLKHDVEFVIGCRGVNQHKALPTWPLICPGMRRRPARLYRSARHCGAQRSVQAAVWVHMGEFPTADNRLGSREFQMIGQPEPLGAWQRNDRLTNLNVGEFGNSAQERRRKVRLGGDVDLNVRYASRRGWPRCRSNWKVLTLRGSWHRRRTRERENRDG